jgi:hypothetical protein
MLRIDFLGTGTLRMSGRMTEGCREEVETYLGSHPVQSSLIVDLTEVTYIDGSGEETLRWLGRRGASFAADNPYALHIFERLHLNIAKQCILPGRVEVARRGRRDE